MTRVTRARDDQQQDASAPAGDVRRRTLLTGAALAGLTATAGTVPAAAAAAPRTRAAAPAPSAATTFRSGLSVSPFTESVLKSVALTDGNRRARTVDEVQRIFRDHGASDVFVRVATRSSARDNDAEHGLTRAIQRAALARRLNLPLNPELGLWAVYGDVSHQPEPDFTGYPIVVPPGPWTGLTIDSMARAMRQYGAVVAALILATGVDVDVWDLGNEVEFGLAGVGVRSFTTSTAYWTYSAPNAVDPAIGTMDIYTLLAMTPADRNSWLSTHVWPYVGRLLAAVAAGIRSVDPSARFSTHTSTIAMLLGMSSDFWRAMRKAGFDAAELGTSYYPTSSAAVDQVAVFRATAEALHTEFGRPVFVAETGYPSGTMQPPYAWNDAVAGYPLDTQGEYAFLRDLVAWGARTGHVSGLRPWAPDYCTAGWQPMSHFTVNAGTATAEPVINAIRDGVVAARATRSAG